ncbi:MAG: pilus assembly protein [Lachnospiraceae bacterium]|nr:pilus assembly protein [Lachnospiraceae bacterium]
MDVKASVTIEASLILPFAIFLIWNILYVSFFVYDQALLTQGSYTTALKAERHIGDLNEKSGIAEMKYENDVKDRIVIGSVTMKQTVTDEETEVETQLSLTGPGSAFYNSNWGAEQKKRVDGYRPVNFIRNCRQLEKIKSGLK